TIGGMAAAQSLSLAYSREDEMEADKTGFRFLTDAGYTGKGILMILKKMRNKQWFGPNQIPTYLLTHPALEERIAYLGARIDESAETVEAGKDKSGDFPWVHTKLLALYGEEDAARRKFKTTLAEDPADVLANYGYGLFLERTDHLKDGVGHLKAALAKNAFNPHILNDLGRVYYMDGQHTEALNILTNAASVAPNDPAGRLYLGRTQIALGKYEEAVLTLARLTRTHEDFYEAYYYLGEAYGKQNNTAKSHGNLGIYYKKYGRLQGAIFHLEKALEAESDPDEKDRIEDLLEELREKWQKQRRAQSNQ
ncbi:MAG: tetratricopeptide repeat protein, partial [Desulfobacterales bacterium]